MTTIVNKLFNKRLTIGWFLIMFLNFLFGVTGIVICTLKLRYVDDEEIRYGFFEISMVFAACNLILSVMLLVSVLKRDQKYAFLYALLIFLSLFAATIHIESHPTKNLTFLLIFVVFAMLCFFWFFVYGSYQLWLKDIESFDSEDSSVVDV